MMQPIVIFGAALKKDATPHCALIARIQAATQYGMRYKDPLYIVTGGNPKAGLTEAAAMKTLLLQAGIHQDRIICEDQAKNTVESVILSSILLKQLNFVQKQNSVTLVSSPYHLPRCGWLMFLSGWRVCLVGSVGKASRSFIKCWYWRLREIPAIICDSFRLFF
ncbi:YdcF family protein [Commensalibacter oyaizuii]|uniref:YdcF family protein n=1 Tax=Commensalibacter oyaizuii TaxID=3043873 RepID=A0ABT6Q1P5_9PROT|nr:YdcF family protein [Commensalibacter sp. TBRC 16381]MDI2091020.1 YdcF family protein [Commensalibacter sp. TBRC 16381]